MNGRSQLQRVRTKISALRLDTDHEIHQDRRTIVLTNIFVIIYIYLYSSVIAHDRILIAIIYQMPNNGTGNVQTTTKSLMKSRTQLSKLTQLQDKRAQITKTIQSQFPAPNAHVHLTN